jgi:hypothetical protein
MHWTLVVLIALSFACLAGNAVRLWTVGTFRETGFAVCLAWLFQQFIWADTGADSRIVFALCDAAIIWLCARERHWTAWGIIALMPVCWAAQFPWGPEVTLWWINWTAVAIQMALGLPWPKLQPIIPAASHGRLRGAA